MIYIIVISSYLDLNYFSKFNEPVSEIDFVYGDFQRRINIEGPVSVTVGSGKAYFHILIFDTNSLSFFLIFA